MKVHKITELGGRGSGFWITECGDQETGREAERWSGVTCRRCLARRSASKPRGGRR